MNRDWHQPLKVISLILAVAALVVLLIELLQERCHVAAGAMAACA